MSVSEIARSGAPHFSFGPARRFLLLIRGAFAKGVAMFPLRFAVLLALLAVSASAISAQPKEQDKLERDFAALAWQRGPNEGRIGSLATVKVREHQAFLDAPNTRRFLELNGNPPRDNHYTLVGPDMAWFAVFSFNDSGYVRDDEKLDAD